MGHFEQQNSNCKLQWYQMSREKENKREGRKEGLKEIYEKSRQKIR
jgi:hypothetical protein